MILFGVGSTGLDSVYMLTGNVPLHNIFTSILCMFLDVFYDSCCYSNLRVDMSAQKGNWISECKSVIRLLMTVLL